MQVVGGDLTLRALSHRRREPMALPADRSQRPARRDRNLHHGSLHASSTNRTRICAAPVASTKQKGPPSKAALSFLRSAHQRSRIPISMRQLCCRFSPRRQHQNKSTLPNCKLSAVSCQPPFPLKRCVGPRLPLRMRDPLPAPDNRLFCNGISLTHANCKFCVFSTDSKSGPPMPVDTPQILLCFPIAGCPLFETCPSVVPLEAAAKTVE